MAPFVRGKRGARGNSQFSSRGTSRGRGSNRGRGRGGPRTKNGGRSTFYSTRVEEQVDDDAKLSLEDPAISDDESVSDVLDDSNSDVNLENEQTHRNPYNTLLLSLNAKTQDEPSERKKRKFDREIFNEASLSESHEKQLKFQDDPGTAEGDGLDDQPDPDEADVPNEIEEDVEQEIEDVAVEDPFSRHIADPEEAYLAKQIKHIKAAKLTTIKVSTPSELTCSLTAPEELEMDQDMSKSLPRTTLGLQLKQRLQKPAENLLSELGNELRVLTGPMFDYKDLLYVERTIHDADSLRKVSCLHVLNHLYKTRDRVIKNNARLAKDSNEVDLEFRDQGFTRPKVLIILPTRQICAKWVETIVSLCEPEQQENRKRLQESYTRTEDNLSEEKPVDFQELFGGNDDDMFRVGLKFTRKTIKYFSQFYNSDIIFTSPLGLRMAIGMESDKKHDHDYLSSIEIAIVDQADALSMQNWEHIEFIFEYLNLQPKEAHGCDFSRVRNWYLDGNARYLRQTMIFSAFNFPALNRLYLHQMLNVAGKIKLTKRHEGAMLDLGISVKQTFSRFSYVNPSSEPDDRFAYFSTAIVPILTKHSTQSTGGKQGILVYLPSYADFVRVRNHLATSSAAQNISFGSISEYTSVRDVARARSHFFTGRHSVLLYTERAHHFRRYHLRGVKRIFMYGLPENPIFYKEVVGRFLGSSIREGKPSTGEAGVRSLFSKLDVLKLERIVGSSRMSSMVREKGGDTFDFI